MSEFRWAWRLLLLRRLDEPFEQRTEFAGAIEVLGMPLHAEYEPLRRILDGFDNAIGSGGRGDESCPDGLDRLMVTAVHRKATVLLGFAHQAIDQAAVGDPDFVRDGHARFAHV